MISKSVGETVRGRKAANYHVDVKNVQKLLNMRKDLLKGYQHTYIEPDGKYGNITKGAIFHIQQRIVPKPDGRIDPYGKTIKTLWPLAYSNPTGRAIRGSDAYGQGHHGASRGRRIHDGTDYIATPGQFIKAPMSGKVNKISKPYRSGVDAAILLGIEIEASNGNKCWVWYMQPSNLVVGSIVQAGRSIIGIAKTLTNRYQNGMTDHIHIRIHSRTGTQINPATVIR